MTSSQPQEEQQQPLRNEEESRPSFFASTKLSKQEQQELLLSVLPACQPQEGSPANTFTQSELDDLKRALPNTAEAIDQKKEQHIRRNTIDISDKHFFEPQTSEEKDDIVHFSPPPQDGSMEEPSTTATAKIEEKLDLLDWHGAPRFSTQVSLPRAFREDVRAGRFTSPTNGVCPGFLQCNLVVLPQGRHAFDFLLFCQRNPKSCPLIEVCDVGSPFPSGVAPGADLRTDVPKYSIYRNGEMVEEVTDVTEMWPEESVAFLIGCSFSYDGALLDADIPLRSAELGRNVPMYKTSLKCRPAGSLTGTMVVSMKPIPALKISKHVEITSKYTHAHGGPVCIGKASAIGIRDIDAPEWGERIDVGDDEVPVFHACGVTPQSILMESKVPFAITHSAGHMFVTDLPSDMGV